MPIFQTNGMLKTAKEVHELLVQHNSYIQQEAGLHLLVWHCCCKIAADLIQVGQTGRLVKAIWALLVGFLCAVYTGFPDLSGLHWVPSLSSFRGVFVTCRVVPWEVGRKHGFLI